MWEGRFKACLVQEEDYLLQVYRYIEMNPVRAGIVAQPSDYFWSSYNINRLGKESYLCVPHPLYLALGNDTTERQARYRELFASHIDGKQLEEIRSTVNKGMVLGHERFVDEVAALAGRRMATGKCGRPVGWRKNGNHSLCPRNEAWWLDKVWLQKRVLGRSCESFATEPEFYLTV